MGAPLNHSPTASSDFDNGRINPSDKALEASEGHAANYEHVRQVDSAGLPPRQQAPGGSKVKRHCAKFWWAYVIGLVLILLLVTLLIIFVAVPKLAQKAVDQSFLEVTVLKFLNPAPTSLSLTQGAILHSPSIFTPILDSFSAGSWLVTNGTFAAAPMIFIQMPQIHALHPTSSALVDNQLVHANDLEQLNAYSTAVLSLENVTSALTGKTKLRLGHLPVVNINYNTTTTYKGLNGLKGFNVTDARINLTAAAGTDNFFGNAFIPNPSLMTIQMGNVTLSIATAQKGVVGKATIQNMTLVPGSNNLPLTAIVNQTTILQSVGAAGMVELLITGNESVYNGQRLPYYEAALASNILKLDMNITQVIQDSL